MFKTHRQTEEDDGHFRRFPRNLVLSVGLALMMPGGTQAQLQQHARHALGTINFPVTCSSQAQTEFNRAVALLHHMTYPQAREAFQHVAALDPHCAMAHWTRTRSSSAGMASGRKSQNASATNRTRAAFCRCR